MVLASSPASAEECTAPAWANAGELYEYSSNANPPMEEIPFRVFGPSLHEEGPSRVVPFDLREELKLDYAATSPNLLAGFVRVKEGDALDTGVTLAATSQAFYVIRGVGVSETRAGRVEWAAGDMFVLPYFGDEAPRVCETGSQCVRHACHSEPLHGGCALYWVHDEPLLQYLGVKPTGASQRFAPAFYSARTMNDTVHSISNVGSDGAVKNRRGILVRTDASGCARTSTPLLVLTMGSLMMGVPAALARSPTHWV